MKKENKKLFVVYRILLFILMAIIVLIVSVSIYSILRPQDSDPVIIFGKNRAGSAVGKNSLVDPNISVFNGIGRLRIPIAGSSNTNAGSGNSSNATMILSIAFPYPANDQPFKEELAAKITNFRSLSIEYISSLPASAFINLDEENLKKELLKQFNAILRLGKIETLYFNDLLIIE